MGMSSLAEELGHLKSHVQYPATRAQVVAACNNMSHINPADKDWFAANLPEGTYKGPNDIVNALWTKV